ncbi:MAG: HDIG domain-containing protein [Deltaproteobacteria bacterium]|nr:HDIG domain-containing protein [Deltaproteobacteria bacterium]
MVLPSRTDAVAVLHEHLQGEYVLRHSLATEAVLRALATHLQHDPELWSITGLLHDLDLELVGDDMSRHARETVRILRERFDYPQEGLDAILSHNGDVLDIPCRTPFEHALTAGESITGLVFATALVLPSRKLADVKSSSVAKRIKEPRFAAKVSRERIGHHNDLGLDAARFCAIAVDAMKSILPAIESSPAIEVSP